MIMIAIDTSSHILGISIIDLPQNKIIVKTAIETQRNHAILLIPSLEKLLVKYNLNIQDIKALVVNSGPGSYTGIRIGVAAAKAMSWALNIPLYSESSLQVLAMNKNGSYYSIPLIDARRRSVYSAAYKKNIHGRLIEVIPQTVIKIEDWLFKLNELEQRFCFLGIDVEKYHSDIINVLGEKAFFGQDDENNLCTSNLAFMGREKWMVNTPGEKMFFVPNYLQLTQAEKHLFKGDEQDDN